MDGKSPCEIKENVGMYQSYLLIYLIKFYFSLEHFNFRSCWAFATVTALSFNVFTRTNVNYVFSPQNLLDCSSNFGNDGCNGGWPPYAFEYIFASKITTESNYPYVEKNVPFSYKKNNFLKSKLTMFVLTFVKNTCNTKVLASAPMFGMNSIVLIKQNDENSVKQVNHIYIFF